MSWGPDKQGINGVYLGKNVIECAGAAIKAVVTQVGVLKGCVWSEAQRGGLNVYLGRSVINTARRKLRVKTNLCKYQSIA